MVIHKAYKTIDGRWVYPADVIKNPNGLLMDKDGSLVEELPAEKMSKSKKNLISQEEIIDTHGIDAARLFIISDTPPEKDFDWNTEALDGSLRFLNRVWKIFHIITEMEERDGNNNLIKITHLAIKHISEKYEANALNKVSALLRELFNNIEALLLSASKESIKFAFETFIKMLYPITPCICQEMWQRLGYAKSICDEQWPQYDASIIVSTMVTIAIQVNGRLRDTIDVEKDLDEEILKQKAIQTLGTRLNQAVVKKIIAVKNRVVNVVI
jgi:leucyl-tRNA synthetase